MWKCEKCGREFKNNNQHHFCGKIVTIDDYIADQEEKLQPLLERVRSVIRGAAPNAGEKIAWLMPTFTLGGENLIHFAASKKHLGLYPGYIESAPFQEKLKSYGSSKGTIQFPYKGENKNELREEDFEFIKEVTEWRVRCVTENHRNT